MLRLDDNTIEADGEREREGVCVWERERDYQLLLENREAGTAHLSLSPSSKGTAAGEAADASARSWSPVSILYMQLVTFHLLVRILWKKNADVACWHLLVLHSHVVELRRGPMCMKGYATGTQKHRQGGEWVSAVYKLFYWSQTFIHTLLFNTYSGRFFTLRQVVLIPEEPEDMWHAYNLVTVGDSIKSTTIRYTPVYLYMCALCSTYMQYPGKPKFCWMGHNQLWVCI